jgi:hypothetical protein
VVWLAMAKSCTPWLEMNKVWDKDAFMYKFAFVSTSAMNVYGPAAKVAVDTTMLYCCS